MATKKRVGLWGLLLGELGLLIPLLGLERRMKRAGGPGIIPFELAGTSERAQEILGSWGADGRSAARISLVLDFPFLLVYSGVHAAWCRMASDLFREQGRKSLAGLGDVAVGSQVIAGACDAVENAALLGVLAGRVSVLPRVARSFALAKFALLAGGWAYAGLAFAMRGGAKR